MYCRHCGAALADDSKFCSNCGMATAEPRTDPGGYAYRPPATPPQTGYEYSLVYRFAERVKINAIIWIVIGGLQILLGLFVEWVLLIVGAANLITSFADFNYAKKVLQDPRGILDHVRSLVSPILTLLYNLIFGGVIGIAGSIYYLVAVRGFVMENETFFKEIEEDARASGR